MARKISEKLFNEFERRLATHPLFATAVKKKDARLLLTIAASVWVGLKEKTGKNDGEWVEEFQKVCGGSKGDPWCMYFVQGCIAYVERKLGIKSHMVSSGHCMTVWNATKLEKKAKFFPAAGAIPIWRRGTSSSGHTEVMLSADNKNMKAVGANTSGADTTGKVTREGNGCFYTTRSMQGFPNLKTTASMKLQGFIIPF